MESITQGIYHASKYNFMVQYKEVHKALSPSNNRSRFASSGLVLLKSLPSIR